MSKLNELEIQKNILYKTGFFSGDYSQDLYLKKANIKEENRVYLSAFGVVNGELERQGYLYFTVDFEKKVSQFIGVFVDEKYRNLHIASFLVASWIDLCWNQGLDFLGVNHNQRKPFLLYLLKTYGFEVFDLSLYQTRKDVITICRSKELEDKQKYLLFKDEKHEKAFLNTNVYQTDNYEVIHNPMNHILLDQVIMPLQNRNRKEVYYELLKEELANTKIKNTIESHQKGKI